VAIKTTVKPTLKFPRHIVMGAVLLLAACAPPKFLSKPEAPTTITPEQEKEAEVKLQPSTFSALNGWAADDRRTALGAFVLSCQRIKKMSPNSPVAASAKITGGVAADWVGACRAAEKIKSPSINDAKQFFENWFMPYLVMDNSNPDGLFTGYFEPELAGALARGGAFQTPLYARPDDLVSASLGDFNEDLAGNTIWGRVENGRLKPYAPRSAIENGTSGANLRPIAWVADPVEAFFLHVQGSGRVRIGDGTVLRLGFAGKNGREYKSIGRVLIDRGEIPADRLTMDSISEWVKQNPEQGRKLLHENPSFVFFRELSGPGPIGAAGVALTPGRSLAIDRRYLPLGAPIWVETTDPLDGKKPLNRLMITQDTGGAIKGVVRGDIFFGAGFEARKMAGNMKRAGKYFILLPTSLLPQ